MGLFTWDGESEDAERDALTIANDTGTDAMNGAVSAPMPTSLVTDVPAPPASSQAAAATQILIPAQVPAPTVAPPLTRRELRERERAAELRGIAAATATTPVAAAEPVSVAPVAPDLVAPEHVSADLVSERVIVAQPSIVYPVAAERVVLEPVVAEPVVADIVEQIFAPDAHTPVSDSPVADSPVSDSATLSKKPKGRGFRRTRRPVVGQTSSARPTAHHAGRRSPLKRRILTKLMSVGGMAGAALMLVATSLPANAFLAADAAPLNAASAQSTASAAASDTAAAPVAAEAQSLKMDSTVAAPVLSRDGYTAVSLREQIFLRYGNRNYAYLPNPTGAIRWPFPIAVPISDGFGYRVSPCGGCSSDHHGVDFTPGAGAAVGVIADGVVVGVNSEDWSYGQHVLVDHVINGQRIQSWYAHMQTGSIRVQVGDQLKVGDIIGLVGSTGASTGAHLHLEIHVNDVPVDPFAWLKANAG